MTSLKSSKATIRSLGSKNDNAEEGEKDDLNAGNLQKNAFWKVPFYEKNWQKKLKLKLNENEAKFLKDQIIENCPDTMIAFILKNEMTDVLEYDSFLSLDDFVIKMPKQIQDDYKLACDFAEFNYILQIIYNKIISNGENEFANEELKRKMPELVTIANNLDIEKIMIERLHITDYNGLGKFLRDSKELMAKKDIPGLEAKIISRECNLKGESRAKTKHPGEFGNSWLGGRYLDYRFSDAQKIIFNDIFNCEVENA